MQRINVRLAQKTLTERGFYRGDIDGILGPAMRAAVRQFQSTRKLHVNGELDEATLRALEIY